MKVKISTNHMDSTHYRVLFELAKKEGIEALTSLLKDLQAINNTDLGQEAIFYKKHRTLSLIRENKAVITYLREHKNELKGLNLTKPDVISVVDKLAATPEKLDTYIENSKLLEEYKIGSIINLSSQDSLYDVDIRFDIYRNKTGEITDVVKYYTDGELEHMSLTEPRTLYNYQTSRTRLVYHVPATWILRTENHEDGRQFRYMFISGFDFDTSKLPSEEELQSYEIPEDLKLLLKK